MILRHPIFAATLSLIVCNAVVSLPVAQYSQLLQNFVERIQPPFDNGLQSLVELVELASDTEEVQSICHLGKAVQKTHDSLSMSVSITSAINSRYSEEIVSMTAKVGEHERSIQALRQQLEDLKQRSIYLHEKVSSYRSMAAEYASVLNTVKEELQRKRKERTVTETVMLAISWLPSTLITTPLLLSEIDKLEIQMNELESTHRDALEKLEHSTRALQDVENTLQRTKDEMYEATRNKQIFEDNLKKLTSRRDNIARFLSLLKESDTFLQKFYALLTKSSSFRGARSQTRLVSPYMHWKPRREKTRRAKLGALVFRCQTGGSPPFILPRRRHYARL